MLALAESTAIRTRWRRAVDVEHRQQRWCEDVASVACDRVGPPLHTGSLRAWLRRLALAATIQLAPRPRGELASTPVTIGRVFDEKGGLRVSDKSAIEWTDATWNPVTGCTQVSPGCDNCYALTFAERFRGVAGHPYEQGFDLRLWPQRLALPLRWARPRRIFVNSMSDLFHQDIPLDFIAAVFETMRRADWHVFQVLTKRPGRLRRIADQLPWPENVWAGVSIESSRFAWRADYLREVPAAVRFVSAEPLLGPLDDLDLSGIDWLIAGGESGAGHRPMDKTWVIDLRDRCEGSGVSFFFKQWGGRWPKKGGRELDGHTYDQWPKPVAGRWVTPQGLLGPDPLVPLRPARGSLATVP